MSVHRRITGVLRMLEAVWMYMTMPLIPFIVYLLTWDERHYQEGVKQMRNWQQAWYEGLIWTLTGRRIPEE